MSNRKGSHSVFSVKLHFVFVTHYRRKVLTKKMIERLEEMIDRVAHKMGCAVESFDGESDHVHILLDFHPRNSISAVVGSLKSSTARMLKKEFPQEVNRWYKDKTSFWSRSYYVASSGGAPIEILKQYIDNQDTPTE